MSKLGVMILTWEFPPRIIGGIAPHVYELSRALARRGVLIHIVTCDFPGAPDYEEVNGVHVMRVDSYKFPTPDFPTWIYMMNINLEMKAAEVLASSREQIHIIHAHDWVVGNASVGLKHTFRIPLVATVHSTEYGRRRGIHTDYHRIINSTEAWLAREAWRIICCSHFMALEVNTALGVPPSKIDVIPNGVDVHAFEGGYDREGFRNRFALQSERLVLFVGRLVHEKGPDLLVEAIPKVLHSLDARFVIVGEGYMKEQLITRVNELGVGEKTHITGFLGTETVKLLFRVADVCVFPSIYEPFGIVVLEAMAAKVPVVTTGAGGIGEIVEDSKNAVFVSPTAESIAQGIKEVLLDPSYSCQLRREGYERVSSLYRWDPIAEKTLQFYHRVLSEYKVGKWKPVRGSSPHSSIP